VLRSWWMIGVLMGLAAGGAPGQELAPPDGGVVNAGLLIRQLDGAKRVLMIGAHPDDEDTSLLAAAARGMGARTAYLALNRGEGGQNLIGPELGEGLGLVRTGELVSARRLDGAEQYFTRAYDFGYTKTAEEAFALWGREPVLEDVVRRVREFRPHVIVSVFSGTPRDGHGQHQVAGILAREAFEKAGDPNVFPEHRGEGIEPWQPSKLYRLTYRDPQAATLAVVTGRFDPLLGRSHHQVAMDSRSQHRSQDMGRAQSLGPQASAILLVAVAPGVEPGEDAGLFAGVDTTLAGVVASTGDGLARTLQPLMERYREALRAAERSLGALDPSPAAPPLVTAVETAREIEDALVAAGAGGGEAARVFRRRARLAERALLDVAGVRLDVRVEDDLVVPGEILILDGELWNGGPFPISGVEAALIRGQGWGVSYAQTDARDALAPGRIARWTGEALVPEDEPASVPYFLAQPRDGERYVWPQGAPDRGLPANRPLLRGRVEFVLHVPEGDGFGGAVPLVMERAVTYRGVDKASGEFRKPLLVLPTLSVSPEPAGLVWPLDRTEPREVRVRVSSASPETVDATVRLEMPAGWVSQPATRRVRLAGEGSDVSVGFRVAPSGVISPGHFEIGVVATTADGEEFRGRVDVLDYPHIDRALLPSPSAISLSVFPVQVAAGLRVGYVMGSGDGGVDALRQMGVQVEELGPERLMAGDFDELDVIVLGVRVYETRPDAAAANATLLDFADGGGVLVVQYNKYEYPQGGFAPYPVEMARPHDRVTDEASPVRLVDPDSPVFGRLNRIGPEDFDGWVQERGLYFLSRWDPRYSAPLALQDPGEEPKLGSLAVARVGEGLYIYTGLAFFRQFPAGVPGAYRLFANLVSQDPADWVPAPAQDENP
jgi:LmbE family N-acetylglucosaminyl deacetylase